MESVEGWISSRFSSSTNPFKLCFGHLFWENLLFPHARLCEYVLLCCLTQKYEVWVPKISFIKGENPCNVAKNIQLCEELKHCVLSTLKKTNCGWADESLEVVRLAVGYISNRWQGWAGKSNLLMGLMECEMLKGRQSLAVCPLQMKLLSSCQ